MVHGRSRAAVQQEEQGQGPGAAGGAYGRPGPGWPAREHGGGRSALSRSRWHAEMARGSLKAVNAGARNMGVHRGLAQPPPARLYWIAHRSSPWHPSARPSPQTGEFGTRPVVDGPAPGSARAARSPIGSGPPTHRRSAHAALRAASAYRRRRRRCHCRQPLCHSATHPHNAAPTARRTLGSCRRTTSPAWATMIAAATTRWRCGSPRLRVAFSCCTWCTALLRQVTACWPTSLAVGAAQSVEGSMLPGQRRRVRAACPAARDAMPPPSLPFCTAADSGHVVFRTCRTRRMTRM